MPKALASYCVDTTITETTNHFEFDNPQTNTKILHERMTDIMLLLISCGRCFRLSRGIEQVLSNDCFQYVVKGIFTMSWSNSHQFAGTKFGVSSHVKVYNTLAADVADLISNIFSFSKSVSI